MTVMLFVSGWCAGMATAAALIAIFATRLVRRRR